MKHSLIYLVSLWLMAGLAACTPTIEPEVAYVSAPILPTPDTAVPPPALVHVTTQPTRVINTATAVPTGTPTSEPTAVLPTAPARETPTNVAVTISPISEPPQTITITATTPPTNAQTPTPGWYYYVSDPHGLMMQIPAHWQPALDHPYGLNGDDGFMRLYATNSQDNLLLNACQDMAMGTAVSIEWLTVAGQEACLVTADDGRVAALIVRFPEPREMMVPVVAYHFLVLQADPPHMPSFIQTLAFVPVTATPTP